MNINIVVTRNLQLFVRLAQLPCESIESCMEWRIRQRAVFLEVCQQRVLLTTGRLQEYANNTQLFDLQKRWCLEPFQGILKRIYLLNVDAMVSCCFYFSSIAELWYQIYLQQYALLRSLTRHMVCDKR
ncbi:type III secretion system protein [Candidatus Williamhamiltonella defendens]|uniref:type III secretion system protein n=1 Tax=Candidatus Williamhamiltonella defendens TaxID=138072 RepID=UPI00130D8237|nr:type III secretion system protein [Candidatus Hamiltonella defensa]